MKQALIQTLFILLSISVFSQTSNSKIKSTKGFINYFASIDNMVQYKKIKDNIETTALKIKKDSNISSINRQILETYYDSVQVRSENLYNKILNDLLDPDKRKEIKKDINKYVQEINEKFDDIKTAYQSFDGKYSEIYAVKSAIFVWVLNQFILPLAKSFVREIITEVIRHEIDTYLKPKVVIKKWSEVQ